MRIRLLTLMPLIGILAVSPNRAGAQVTASVQFGRQWGPEVRVYPYARDVDGDWRSSYRRWQPVTVYALNDHFYLRAVPGARAVQVYRFNNQYFLPPRDAAWVDADRRYRYDRRPQDEDYNVIDRVLNLFGGQRPPRNWGSEVVVNAYSPEAFGDWRVAYRRWRPVTLYFRDSRYFSRAVPGSRPVTVYGWNNQYFLPPQDPGWDNYDRRYNYGRRPTDEDYRDIQRLPGQYDQQPPGHRGQQPPDARYGNDVQVSVYSPTVHGDWRNSYSRWETATLYSLNGRYYPTQVAGARPLMVYRWQDRYFLPPRDQGWDNVDRRYDYRLRPTDDDYDNAQRPPGRRP